MSAGILGMNLLNMALSAVGRLAFTYYAYKDQTTNDYGIIVAGYEDPVTLYGNVQPIKRSLYTPAGMQGLDLQKNYMNFFCPSATILDLRRDVTGDRIEYAGKTYQCLSLTDWGQIDGWVKVMAVQIDPEALDAG